MRPTPEPETVLPYTPEELLGMMTIDEKIGQMAQIDIRALRHGDIRTFSLGSALVGGGAVYDYDYDAAQWQSMVGRYVRESKTVRLGIPLLFGIDAVHGHNNVVGATVFPHNVGLGAIAAGDLELGVRMAREIGAATAAEMLMTGIQWTFSPVLGVAEDIRWGRAYECFGEDIDIVTAMGTAVVRGLQESGRVAACIKHYIGEGQTAGGQNQGNALLTDDEVRALLPPYIEAINAGALTLMPSFNSINGLKMHENRYLLTEVLKGELGFGGFIISDWDAETQVSGANYKEQVANTINAGCDMLMFGDQGRSRMIEFIRLLKELVDEGTVPMERIDDAVLRILTVKQTLGLFGEPYYSIPADLGNAKHRALAREAVARSVTLMKNEDDILGRLRTFDSILVAGQGASDIGMQCGGWTIHWQGSHGDITPGTTLLEGFSEYHGGLTFAPDGKASGDYDAAIVVIGESPYAEGQGDRPGGVTLRGADITVLNEVYKLDCPVVVVMLSGRPMEVSGELSKWDGFVAAWLPGTEGAGVADVLFGDAGFTGKSPYTWP
jgi:beta-glucosidase